MLSDLGTCDASKAGATRMVKSTAGAAFNTHPYVPYACDGMGTWKAIGINQDGNLQIAGLVEIGQSLKVGTNAQVNGWQTVMGDLSVGGKTNLNNDVAINAGILRLSSYMSFQNQTSPSIENTGCNDVGNGKGVTMTTQGKILSCQSGVWRSIGPTTVNTTNNTYNNTYPTYNNYSTGALACQQVSGGYSTSGSSVNCPYGYTVTGGGVNCADGYNAYIHESRQNGNGWFGDCHKKDGSDGYHTIYAQCCKVQ